MTWTVKSIDPAALERVVASSSGSQLPPTVQKLVALRQLSSPEAVDQFLNPRLDTLADPFLLPNMEKAITRVLAAIDQKEAIVIYGDYDVDGVTSLTILMHLLRAYGADPRPFLPMRMEEGYGLSREGLSRCLTESQPRLLIAVDCGTSSIDEVAWLQSQGIDVIILDHHEIPPTGPVQCCALVNPKCGQTWHYLCTAGLAWKFGHALLKARRIDYDLRELLEFAAVGTVADVVPLVEENRLMVAKGLIRLATTKHPGLQALKRVAGVNGVPKSGDIGFRIGPRINASGRLTHAQASLELMLSPTLESANPLAEFLDEQNKERQAVQQRIEKEALALVSEDPSLKDMAGIAVGSASWHAGVVGIVAAKLMRKHLKPVFVIAFDEHGIGKGSGRSVEGLSLVQAINSCRDLLIKGGGHDMAAGITIARDQFAAFQERFDASIRQQLGTGSFRPRLLLDAEVPLSALTWEFLDAYDRLEPFGMENPAPVFLLRRLYPSRPPQVLKDKHRKFFFSQGPVQQNAIWFDCVDIPLPPPPWDAAITVERGYFRGEQQLNIHVQALRAAK